MAVDEMAVNENDWMNLEEAVSWVKNAPRVEAESTLQMFSLGSVQIEETAVEETAFPPPQPSPPSPRPSPLPMSIDQLPLDVQMVAMEETAVEETVVQETVVQGTAVGAAIERLRQCTTSASVTPSRVRFGLPPGASAEEEAALDTAKEETVVEVTAEKTAVEEAAVDELAVVGEMAAERGRDDGGEGDALLRSDGERGGEEGGDGGDGEGGGEGGGDGVHYTKEWYKKEMQVIIRSRLDVGVDSGDIGEAGGSDGGGVCNRVNSGDRGEGGEADDDDDKFFASIPDDDEPAGTTSNADACPNAELCKWMDIHGEKLFMDWNPNRRIETWKHAYWQIKRCTVPLISLAGCKQVNGVGPAVAAILSHAPWDTFSRSGGGDSKRAEDKMEDMDAIKALTEMAKDAWASIDGSSSKRLVYVFEATRGLWSFKCEAFWHMLTSHASRLGLYARQLRKMEIMHRLAGMYNVKNATWTQQLNLVPPGLVPFSNGMYDIMTGQLRAFCASDMLTIKFDYDAPGEDDVFPEEEAEVRSILEKIMPEKKLRVEVMMRIAESLFRGKPHEGKYFMQWFGDRDNAKTTLLQMLHCAFPAWVKIIKTEHLLAGQGRTDPNAAEGWKMDIMGSRIVGSEEPRHGTVYDSNLIKALRGGGLVTGRTQYGSNVTYVPTYRLVIASNTPVELDHTDAAILRSIHAFKFPSTFLDAGDKRIGKVDLCFEKVADLHSRFHQRRYALAFFRVLIEYYQLYLSNGLDKGDPSLYDLRHVYAEEHQKQEKEYFDEAFEVVGEARMTMRYKSNNIYEALKERGYAGSFKKLCAWLKTYFRPANEGGACGRDSRLRTVHHGGTQRWIGLRARSKDQTVEERQAEEEKELIEFPIDPSSKCKKVQRRGGKPCIAVKNGWGGCTCGTNVDSMGNCLQQFPILPVHDIYYQH